MILRWFTMCLAVFALELPAQAQSQNTWNSVRAIAPGTEVRVTGPRQGAIRGNLDGATDDSITLTTSGGHETFSRQQIKRVAVKKRGHRVRNTLIGFGVGLVAGLAIGAAADHSCYPDCFIGPNFGKEALTPFGGAVGAIVGVLIPTGGWKNIYKQ